MKLVSIRTWYGGPRAVLWAKNMEVGTCFTWFVSASFACARRDWSGGTAPKTPQTAFNKCRCSCVEDMYVHCDHRAFD